MEKTQMPDIESAKAIRVLFTGEWRELSDVASAVAREPDIEDVDGFDAEPNVIMHAGSGNELAGELASVQRHSDAPILLVATAKTELLLERALAGGAADVLLVDPKQPDAATETLAFAIRKAILSELWRPIETRAAQVFTVFSPKGGTGKSATATNLAVALQRTCDKKVLLIDFDVQFGDVAIMLDLDPVWTLHDIVTAPGELDAEKLAGFTLQHSSGLHVLAAPTRPEEAERLTDGKVAAILDLALGAYDAIVVDTSPYFHGPMLTALDRTDRLLLLSGPDVPTLKNLRLVRQTLEQLQYPLDQIRLILNRAGLPGGLGAGEISAAVELPVSYELPNDPSLPATVNTGNAAVIANPDKPYAKAVKHMAAHLVDTDIRDAAAPKTERVRSLFASPAPRFIPRRRKALT